MMNAIRTGLRQGFGLRFILGAIAMAIVIWVASVDTLLDIFQRGGNLYVGYHNDFIRYALSSDTVAPFVPIVAVLPFAAVYVDDIKTKFARLFLIRSDYGGYLFGRCVVCFLCGGLVILGGVMLAWLASLPVFLPIERENEGIMENFGDLLAQCGMLFLSGGLWAVAGMALSTLMESKYIAYASPFVMYYLLVILYERYFPDAYVIYPREWMTPSELWPYGNRGAVILMAELTALFSVLFIIRAERRLRQL